MGVLFPRSFGLIEFMCVYNIYIYRSSLVVIRESKGTLRVDLSLIVATNLNSIKFLRNKIKILSQISIEKDSVMAECIDIIN